MRADPFLRWAARWLLAAATLLAGCGPGTGGTGLPPAGSAPGPAPTADAGPGAGAGALAPPSAGAPVSAPTLGEPESAPVQPARTAELASLITAVDAETVVAAGAALPRDELRVTGADGSDAPVDLLQPGVSVRVWRVGDVWLVRLEP